MARAGSIGVVTVTYNSAAVLPGFLRCMTALAYADFLLFAVDNASKDDTLRILDNCQDRRIRVIANTENRGVAAGNNQGIVASLAAGCSAVLLLNNDTEFDPELMRHLNQGIDTYDVGMTCPKILYFDEPGRIWAAGGRFQRWAGYRALHWGEREFDRGQYDAPRLVTYVPTCCVLIKREVFDRVGLMDERYFVYADDTDFMYRAMKAKVKLMYLPGATLLHKIGSLTGGAESPFELQYGTRNRAFFLLKHFSLAYALPWLFMRAAFFLCKSVAARKGWTWLRLKEVALWNAWRMYARG